MVPSSRKIVLPILVAFALVMGGAVVHTSTASTVSGAQLAATARAYIGTPYAWGANGPNAFDCSGFIRYVLGRHGVNNIPRVSADQQRWATTVSRANLRPGDLVFYRYSARNGSGADHVKMYVGNGRNIGASTSRGGVTDMPIHEAAVVSYGRAPGMSASAPASGPVATSGTTRAEAARIIADTMGLPDRPNPFGVRRTEAGAVGAVYHAGIGLPYRDGLWRPNTAITGHQLRLWLNRADVTRAEAARIMADVLALPDRPNPFGITTHGGAIGALNHAGIAYPYRDGRFRPGVKITADQVDLWTRRAGL